MDIKNIYYGLFSLLLLAGCQNDNLKDDAKSKDEERGFKFVAYLQEGDKITPLAETRSITTDLATTGYDMIGYATSSDFVLTTSPANDQSRRLFWGTHTDINGKYEGETRNWISDGTTRHSFFAYSPNPPGTVSGYGISNIGWTAANQPGLVFLQHNDPKLQIDLLTANPILNIKADYYTPTLNLYFRHRLSRVAFYFYGTEGAALLDCDVKITYRSNSVMAHSPAMGIAPFSPINYGSTYHSGTYSLTSSKFVVPSSANSVDDAMFVGDLILLPQTVTAGYIRVDISYKLTPSDAPKTAFLYLDGLTLIGETQHSYYLRFSEKDASVSVSRVNLTQWTSEEFMIDELK